MATKEHKRRARGLIETLESRVHLGPPVHDHEIVSAEAFLRQNDFSPASDYFNRLAQIQDRLRKRSHEPSTFLRGKQNYGGEAGGYWMQLQSAYDHIILSTCYDGAFNFRRGRIKISHRFNQDGRIDFVELKFLSALEPRFNGALRKLLTVKGYQEIKPDWSSAEAFILEVLPRELVFLHPEIFHSEKSDLFGWLVNIGHGLVETLCQHLNASQVDGFDSLRKQDSAQLPLTAVRTDDVAWPILCQAATLQCSVDAFDARNALVKYLGRNA